MCNTCRDIIRYYTAVASEDPVYDGLYYTCVQGPHDKIVKAYESLFTTVV